MLKNIVIVSDNADVNGGAADITINTASMLAERGYKIYFFAGTGEPDKKLIHSNINIINLNQYDLISNPNKLMAAFQGIYNFKARREFAKLLSTLNKDETIIHIHTWTKVLSSSIYRAAFKSGFKIFLTIHDYFLPCPNGGFYDFVENHICERQPLSLKCILCNCDRRHYYHKIWRLIKQFVQNRTIFKNFDKIGYIFISEFSRKQILRRMPAPKNQFFVQNPISFADRFRIEAENNKAFLYIGCLSEEKGIRNFCEAINNTGVRGVVIGDSDIKNELESKYPNIKFTGWLNKSQIREWLKIARCLIFPSICYETFGLAPLEVQAYGIPVIASDCTAASDNSTFTYHTLNELENLIKRVDSQDIKQISIDIYKNFDESSTHNYVNNLLKVYESPI